MQLRVRASPLICQERSATFSHPGRCSAKTSERTGSSPTLTIVQPSLSRDRRGGGGRDPGLLSLVVCGGGGAHPSRHVTRTYAAPSSQEPGAAPSIKSRARILARRSKERRESTDAIDLSTIHDDIFGHVDASTPRTAPVDVRHRAGLRQPFGDDAGHFLNMGVGNTPCMRHVIAHVSKSPASLSRLPGRRHGHRRLRQLANAPGARLICFPPEITSLLSRHLSPRQLAERFRPRRSIHQDTTPHRAFDDPVLLPSSPTRKLASASAVATTTLHPQPLLRGEPSTRCAARSTHAQT